MNNNIRLFIMFLIIIGVFYFYSHFLPKPEQVAENVSDTTQVIDTVENNIDNIEETLSNSVIPETMISSDTSIIEFENDLMRGKISTNGGAINSLILKQYTSNIDSVLNIVPNNSKIFLLTLEFKKEKLDLRNTNFSVIYQGDINPLKNDIDSLVLEYRIDTFVIRRTFVFHRNSYIINQKVSSNFKIDNFIYSLPNGLNITEKNTKNDLQYFAVDAFSNKNLIRNKYKHVKDTLSLSGEYEWMGLQTKYFFAGLIGKGSGFIAYSLNDKRIGGKFIINTDSIDIFIGPIDYKLLKSLDNGLEKLPDFGWSWINPISKIILLILKNMYKFIPNYGFVIMLFSLIFILLFSPLTFKSYASMRKMQMIQPMINDLKKKYAKDPQRLNAETMKLYKKYGVNPFTGCLPLFIQMPVFFALYAILRTTIELRNAPFIFWITDLSSKDPHYILPVLTGVVMFLSQKISMTDNSQKMMVYTMPIMMTVFFFNFPSGIVLYWFMYNTLSIGQQFIIRRMIHKEKQEEVDNGKEK